MSSIDNLMLVGAQRAYEEANKSAPWLAERHRFDECMPADEFSDFLSCIAEQLQSATRTGMQDLVGRLVLEAWSQHLDNLADRYFGWEPKRDAEDAAIGVLLEASKK